jgi:hypothetical protein
MTYELAKELKEEGFPQGDNYNPVHRIFEGDVYDPTLSELIEACGESFANLRRWPDQTFSAFTFPNKIGVSEPYTGSTPEEAVARLWLALRKP